MVREPCSESLHEWVQLLVASSGQRGAAGIRVGADIVLDIYK